MTAPQWRTAEDLAQLFGVQVRTVWAWRRRGHITAVEGLYDLREVLRWFDHERDARKDDVRRGVARPRYSRVYLPGRRLHAQEPSDPAATIPGVDFGATFVANGTANSYGPATPDRDPEMWEELLHDLHFRTDLQPRVRGQVLLHLRFLHRLGAPLDHDVYERTIQLATEDAQMFAPPRTTIERPAVVYYLRVGELIKIGQTLDVASRLRAYPPNAVLLATEVGEWGVTESDRHRQFGATRAHRREWFHPSAELIEHINSLREQPLAPADLAA